MNFIIMNEHYYLVGLHFGLFEIVEEHIQDTFIGQGKYVLNV
jgi:hypothetical protein